MDTDSIPHHPPAGETAGKEKFMKKVTAEDIRVANTYGMRNPDSYRSYYTPLLTHAMSLGQMGIDLRSAPIVRGWRYGAAPASGLSYNYANDNWERGLSLAALEGGQVTPSAELFFSERKKYWYTGILVGTGSDAEPLILPIGLIENLDD